MAVNLLDPVTPSGAQAAEGFRSNLVEKARLDMEHTRIATQAELQKAQIDAEVQMKQAEMKHNLLLQQQSITAQQGMQTQRLTAEQEMAQKRLDTEAALEEQRQRFTASQQERLFKHDEDLVTLANERLGLGLDAAAREQLNLTNVLKEKQQERDKVQSEMLAAQMDDAARKEGAKDFSDKVTQAAVDSIGNGKAVYDIAREAALHGIQQAKTTDDLEESRGVARWFEPDPTKEKGPLGMSAGSKGLGDTMRFVEGSVLGMKDVKYPKTAHNDAEVFTQRAAGAIADNLSKVVPNADRGQVAKALHQVMGNVRAIRVAEDTSVDDKKYADAGMDRRATREGAVRGIQEAVDTLRKLGLPDDVTFGILDSIGEHASGVVDDTTRTADSKGMAFAEQTQARKSFMSLKDTGAVARAAVLANKDMYKPDTHVERKVMLDGVATFAASILDRSISKQELQQNLEKAGFSTKKVLELVEHFEKIPGSRTSEQMKQNILLLQARAQGLGLDVEAAKSESAARTAQEQARIMRMPLRK